MKNTDCAICTAEFDETRNEPVIMLTCEHYFHKKCIREWFEKKRNMDSCPRCT